MPQGTTQEELSDGLLTYPEGSSIEFSSEILGTGTEIYIIDNSAKSSGTVIATYTIIIFGDITGDGNIDSNDAGVITEVENYNGDPITNAAAFNAADVNGDGNVDSNDAGLMVEVENYNLTVAQSTGLAS